ncbi:MAG: hypothetical protein EPN39_16425 [Chitinophagaceae bacterium]|nr:MAG: hypothetical protein EPN39_16425 [Chitinophagaceae bacterium]
MSDVQFTSFKNEGEAVTVKAVSDIYFLLLNGQPLNELTLHKGHFVMNAQEEIDQTYLMRKAAGLGK